MLRQKDVKTERRKDGVFLWDVEELTFLISYEFINDHKYINAQEQNLLIDLQHRFYNS
jgi:hypothetical protein